jgi:hypothetical protein
MAMDNLQYNTNITTEVQKESRPMMTQYTERNTNIHKGDPCRHCKHMKCQHKCQNHREDTRSTSNVAHNTNNTCAMNKKGALICSSNNVTNSVPSHTIFQ